MSRHRIAGASMQPGPLQSPELAARARAALSGIAVLFTSGDSKSNFVHDGRLGAVVELLPKPYTRDALARRVRQGREKRLGAAAGAGWARATASGRDVWVARG